MLRILLIVLILSFTSQAKTSCSDLFMVNPEQQVSSVLASELTFSKKSEKINIIVNNHLKVKGYSFHTKKIEGEQVFIIHPGTKHKFSKLATYLDNNYGVELGVSIGHTLKIDAGLEMIDIDLILTSLKDLLNDEIGAASRHELSHLWEISRFEQENAHPVFTANIRSKQPMFNQEFGYQHYITFGEIHAYARELHYSLWKYRHTKEASKKLSIQADIDEAYSKLKTITSKLYKETQKISQDYKKFKVYEDDYIFELKTGDLSLEMPKTEKSAKKQLLKIIDFIEEFNLMLNKTSISNLEDMLKDFLKGLN